MDEQLLSDDEIRELIRNTGANNEILTKQEMDALGEIGNVSIGTSATTLYSLLRNRVVITTPDVSISSVKALKSMYPIPFISVEVSFTKGLSGSNLMIIKEEDAKIIADLMMGGDGTNIEVELDELRMSAVSEAMNQMMGSAATSLSTMLKKDINISPPELSRIDLANETLKGGFSEDEEIVNISFKMEVGNILNSEIMQLMPVSFAKTLVEYLYSLSSSDVNLHVDEKMVRTQQEKLETHKTTEAPKSDYHNTKNEEYGNISGDSKKVVVNPVQFEAFDDGQALPAGSNLGLIMDVPLEVTVELGRTVKTIKEIVELGPGSIVELDKMAGEHVDILVNGKFIAKGEVVVVDENFGVRITDIVNTVDKISSLQ
jgi:flagellar motor switch protein FliN/FliY